jgi:hypothetical protein
VADQDVAEIKRALSDPTRVLEALGIMGQGKARARQAGGWMIRCPVHEDGSPSCSVQNKGGVILWKCWGCLPVATSVLTPLGFRRLGDLVEGDRVFGSSGTSVVMKTYRARRERVLRVQTVSDTRGVFVTGNHRMLVTDAPVTPHSLARQRWTGKLLERDADELQPSDWLPFCIPEQTVSSWRIRLHHGRTSPLARKELQEVDGHEADLAWAFGLYAAEGSAGGRCVTFSIHIDEVEKFLPRLRRVADMFGATASVRTWPDRENSAEIRISSAVAADVFAEHCGSGTENKRCPAQLLLGPVRAAAFWLLGLRDGDGSRARNVISVTSSHLVDAAFVIAARCHAFPRRWSPSYPQDKLPIYGINFAAGSMEQVESATRASWIPRHQLRKSEAVVRLADGRWALCSKLVNVTPEEREQQVVDVTTSDGTFSTPTLTVHNCEATGDVLSLIAAVRGLKIDTDFKRVLVEGARLAGMWQLVDKLEGRGPRDDHPAPAPAPLPPPVEEPPRAWPPKDEVDALWASCVPTYDDPIVAAYLRGRSLDPDVIDSRDLARAISPSGALPRWAYATGGTWREVGYRLLVGMYDATGEMRSVRAWRVVDGDGAKRKPPFGHKAGEMVMADAFGRAMLRGEIKPYRIGIVEGEPDFLSRASVTNDAHGATFGIVSGSWTKAFAERVPLGARVYLRTDVDEAGNRYAQEIENTLRRRAFLWRRQA